MRRWHNEVALMRQRMRLEREKHGVDPDNHDGSICHCLLGIGFVRKRRPYDCGRPQCGLCHPAKRWHSKERRSAEKRTIEFELEAAS